MACGVGTNRVESAASGNEAIAITPAAATAAVTRQVRENQTRSDHVTGRLTVGAAANTWARK
jgi:hypothetical protein